MGEDQRPTQPNKIGKAFNDMKYALLTPEGELSLANKGCRYGNESGK